MVSELSGWGKVGSPGAYPDPANCHWPQELALRRLATRRQAGGGDHEPDPVGAPEWARALRLSEERTHAPADSAAESDRGVVAASVEAGVSLRLGQEGIAGGLRARLSAREFDSSRHGPSTAPMPPNNYGCVSMLSSCEAAIRSSRTKLGNQVGGALH
jgi:hypothetical protein